jgi:hypothetical protein
VRIDVIAGLKKGRIMRIVFNVIAVSILAGFVPTQNLAGGDMPFRLKNGKEAAGIPFELNSNKIFVSVRIDAGQPSWFIIDSGCPVTSIEMTLARKLGLSIEGKRQIGGAGEGRTSLGTTKVKSLGLPGLDLFPTLVWALAVNEPVAPFEGRRIDGLLGVDFLEQFVVRIDYPNRKLDVVSPEEFHPGGKGVSVPLEKVGGHYAVKGKLELPDGRSVEGRFIVDVGVRLPMLLATPFVNRNDLIAALAAEKRHTVGGGLGGQTFAHLGRLQYLTIGELKVAAPYVAMTQDKRSFLAGDDTQGLLGADVFRRYCFTLDLPHKRVIFEATPESNTPYEYDMSGMFVIGAGSDYHRFEVLDVLGGGPAARAGIEKGDVVLELDGVAATRLTLEQLRAAFRDAGATRELTLERQGQRFTAKLRLRQLV